MTHAFTRSLSATVAISAVLALGSTPVFAQDAAPAIQLPPPAATSSAAPVTSTSPTTTVAPSAATSVAAPAAPAIVLPDVSAAPSEPKSASAPVESRAERTVPERTVQRSATRVAAAPASPQAPSRASAPTAAPSQAEAALASSHNILAADPVAPAGNIARPAATPAPAQDRGGDGLPGEAIAGLLAALGLGAVGYAMMRSRRRRDEDEVAYDTAIEPVAAEPPAFAPEARSDVAEPAPRTASVFGATGIAGDRQVQYGFARSSVQAPADGELLEREPMVLATPVAPAAAPNRKAPAPLAGSIGDMSAEERTRLIDEMVEAEPDEANPFIARPARRKRARLILQRMEHEQRQNSNAPFDWRTYRPTTEPTEPASPPLVTA
jgi:hypothetical protein